MIKDKPNTPCSECKFFYPDVNRYMAYEKRTFMEWIKNNPRKLSSKAIEFAKCSYFGGNYAALDRKTCKGEYWEKK